MIDDLSRTLRSILTQKGLPLELAAAQIVFEHPSEKFTPQQTTVDLFLYDIREDLELRSNEPLIEHKNGHVVTHQPPLRVACSYLVTAWPVGGADLALQEQRLLGQVLRVFSQVPKIPAGYLQGCLKGQTPPLPMVTALVDPQKNLSEFWTALGSQLRPSLTITVTFSMPLLEPEMATVVLTEAIGIGQRTAPDEEEIIPSADQEIFGIGVFGRVTDPANTPIPAAIVTVTELGIKTKTDSAGRYQLVIPRPGTYKILARKGPRQTVRAGNAVAGTECDIQLKPENMSNF